jgi:hypothetical protein
MVRKAATRKPTSRTRVRTDVESLVKALNPKDTDTGYLGNEPYFPEQPASDTRVGVLTKSFSWYSRFFGRKDAKELMIQFLDMTGKTQEAKAMAKVDDAAFVNTYSWLARMSLRGLELTEQEAARIEGEVTRLIETVTKPQAVVESRISGKKQVKEETTSNRPNVQEIMRERAREAGGELEGAMDDFITAGSKANASADAVGFLTKYNVLPQHISIVIDAWKRKQAEYEEVLAGTDAQLVQAYSHLTKTQVKNTIKFIEAMLGNINSYLSNKKATKAPRKRKAVPPEKQVSKLKYLKEFKDPANKIDLVSIHPSKLLTASEAWVYDTAKRKLHHYVADDLSKTFSVKGNTILGIDTVHSEMKTLRKPGEQLKEVMGSKPAARKYFKTVKAVSTVPNGRFNAGMIILRCF